MSDKPRGAGQGSRHQPLRLGSRGQRAQCPDGLHSLLKAPAVRQAAQAPPVNSRAKLFGPLGTGPTAHARTLNPSLALKAVMFVSLSCVCEIPSTPHGWGPHISPETTPDRPAPRPGWYHWSHVDDAPQSASCTFSPVSTLEPELPSLRGTPSCT